MDQMDGPLSALAVERGAHCVPSLLRGKLERAGGVSTRGRAGVCKSIPARFLAR